MAAAGMQTKTIQGQAVFRHPSQSSCWAGLSPTIAKRGRQMSLSLTGDSSASLRNERMQHLLLVTRESTGLRCAHSCTSSTVPRMPNV